MSEDSVQEIMNRWRPDYVERASVLEADLRKLFQEAITKETPGDLIKHGGVSSSLTFLRSRVKERKDQIVLFLYSGHYDPDVAKELFNLDKTYREGNPTPREICEEKIRRLKEVFEPFVLLTDTLAGHFVAALMQGRYGSDLPLIWDVPIYDEAETGFSPHALWWTSFQYLCEISTAIFVYGGCSREFKHEIEYVLGNTHLKRRALWLDQELHMYFPDEDNVTWSAKEVAKAIAEVQRRSVS